MEPIYITVFLRKKSRQYHFTDDGRCWNISFKLLFCFVWIWNLLGKHCERIRLSFQSIVCPRLSLCLRVAEDGKQCKFSNLFWVRWFIGCTQKHPIHHWGRRHAYIIADGYLVHSVSVWKRWNSEV